MLIGVRTAAIRKGGSITSIRKEIGRQNANMRVL